ncbi:VOC family protein [Nocardioides gilvus]|uniref:VOC family protein n=1 Tax=Nocardioides gilvus TaxID=1735589 RepID=UPI000D74DFDF|nr:VOC family protein [Nocardioides gilvus]
MNVRLAPYLKFADGQARAAMEFYRSTLGGELSLMEFRELGVEGAAAELVMHGKLVTEHGLVLYGSDAPPISPEVRLGEQVMVSVMGQDSPEARAWFGALSAGGEVTMPLELQPWGDHYGEFVDRFGVPWMFDLGELPDSEPSD